MNKIHTISIVLATALAIALWPPPFAHADEIHLKNGQVIEADNVRFEGDQVKFEKYGGTIAISRAKVEDVVRTAAKDQAPAEAKGDKGLPAAAAVSVPDKDLVARLTSALHPGTPVEQANICTVAVKTVNGSGSGFFISDTGLIVTNRHVVRGDAGEDNKTEAKFAEARDSLRDFKQYLDGWQNKLSRSRANLEKDWARLRDFRGKARSGADKSYAENRKRELSEFEKYLGEKERELISERDKYLAKKAEVDGKYQKYQEGKRQLAGQGTFEVVLADNSNLYATLYKVSREHDLALLGLSGYRTPYLKPVSREKLVRGEDVFALGSPLGLAMKNTVTSGVISGFRENYVQTNAQIYPGNSGGPLIDDKGRVIGVNTMKQLTRNFEGLGFAIPIGTVLADFHDYLPGS